MSTENKTIQVDPDVARAYDAPSEEDKKKMQFLIRLWLRELSASPELTLTEVMNMISDRALGRGLTPEIVESILNER